MNIEYYNSIDISIFSCIILLVIIFHTITNVQQHSLSARYRGLLAISLLAILTLDIVAQADFPFSMKTNHTVYYCLILMYFILQPLPVSLGLMYLFSLYREQRFSVKYHLLFLIPFFIGFLAVVYSIFTDYVFYIDDANIYHRGPGCSFSPSQIILLPSRPSD